MQISIEEMEISEGRKIWICERQGWNFKCRLNKWIVYFLKIRNSRACYFANGTGWLSRGRDLRDRERE